MDHTLLIVILLACLVNSEAWMLYSKPCRTYSRILPQLSAALGQEYNVEVSFEGRSCEVSIQANQTILAAMERAGVSATLAIPELPSDCRRGNCLTCTASHAKGSLQSSLQRGEDGLSPHMSREVAKGGYILTCSSHVAGEGLKLELGKNHRAWNDMYRVRVEDESAQLVGRAAMAKTIRLGDEKNVEKWLSSTEAVLEKSDE